MTFELRSKYANYIAECIRTATDETGLKWPDDTILCVKSYSVLAEFDTLVGMPIWVMDMPSAYDFFPAFPANNKESYPLQKAFNELLSAINFCDPE